MQRFYINSSKIGENNFILDDKEIVHQLSKVLRSKPGDEIIVFNGTDNKDYKYSIAEINKKDIVLKYESLLIKNSEIDFELNLYQALPNKLEKVEYIIQKASEVGFTSFTFFKSERSQRLVLSDKKIERLEKIIIEAVEQSGRNSIPKLNIIEKLDIKNISGENIFFHTQDNKSINIVDFKIKNKKRVNLFVGPEGGWSEEEVKNFENNVFFKVYLGNRIMRTETVAPIIGFWIINN
ncbi:MAG: RsmE family RNA methyltransferase [Candidatus Gracilibacteria bacterium]|nr:RsmE family RNA methyltransferase [Candidatus Gracilibacteria bacterium]